MATTNESTPTYNCIGDCLEGCPNPECVNICQHCGNYSWGVVAHPDGTMDEEAPRPDFVRWLCPKCSVNKEGVPHCKYEEDNCGLCSDRWEELRANCDANCRCPHPFCHGKHTSFDLEEWIANIRKHPNYQFAEIKQIQ